MLIMFVHSECDPGYFGYNCSSQCYCKYDSCDPHRGVCSTNECQPGWQSQSCSEGQWKQCVITCIELFRNINSRLLIVMFNVNRLFRALLLDVLHTYVITAIVYCLGVVVIKKHFLQTTHVRVYVS